MNYYFKFVDNITHYDVPVLKLGTWLHSRRVMIWALQKFRTIKLDS